MLSEQEREEILAWISEAASADDERLARGHQGSLYLFEGDRGKLVVKVPTGRGLGQWVRRLMIRNEYRAYRQLEGVEGVPRCHGLIDGRYLVLDYVDADSLETHKLVDAESFYSSLQALIERVHAAGLAHGDLRRRSNVLVAAGERPVLIDFGVALRCGPGSSRLRRRAVDLMQQDDHHSWMKLKYRRRRFAPPEYRKLESPAVLKRIRRLVKQLRSLRSAWREAPVGRFDQNR